MTTTDTDIIATGGFNTGRQYTAEGQRIFWAKRADGWVYFNDTDRMISGWIDGADTTPRAIVMHYDLYDYHYKPEGGHPARINIPADTDYGAALRI